MASSPKSGSNTPSAGPSKSKTKPAKAITHDGAQTIRAQSKKDKDKSKVTNPQDVGDRAGMSKEVVKAVLASPLTVTWPNIPRHLQNATLHALKELIPSEIADYHVSRARCHQREKRAKRRILHKGQEGNGKDQKEDMPGNGEDHDVVESQNEERTGSKRPSKSKALSDEPLSKKPRLEVEEPQKQEETSRPLRPEILSHMVLGINEVLKSLESQISELKIRLMIMGDALNGIHNSSNGKGKNSSHLLPTAPRSPSPSPEPELANAAIEQDSPTSAKDVSPLEFIVIPLLSINPPSLVSPIPQYCATYNSLVYHHQHLSKICRTRLKATEVDAIVGETKEEIRVVPLGAVEKEIAQLVGLRRVACLGLRSSHPSLSILRNLLPKSILHPPRHSITLPIPTSSLSIHKHSTKESSVPKIYDKSKPKAPIPRIHYADLHIKGIKTKTPVDNAARKAKRLEEVRRKRVESKLKKKEFKEKAKDQAKRKSVS